MIECLLIGDSIAVAFQQFKPECVLEAKGGINSRQWNQMFLSKSRPYANVVIISLGTNDHKHINTKKELDTMRKAVEGNVVYWILPNDNLPGSQVDIKDIQQHVKAIANQYGDTVITSTRYQKDNIHPSWAGHKQLVDQVHP